MSLRHEGKVTRGDGMASTKPECEEFVTAMEELLEKCSKDGRLRMRREFTDEFPFYSSIRNGRRGLPSRNEVMSIADFLKCTFGERNKLLIEADCSPIDDYIDDKQQLADIMLVAHKLVNYLPYPSFAVTRDDTLHEWNELTTILFNIPNQVLKATPERDRSVLRYIFDPSTPVYSLLTNNSKNTQWWRYTAKLNIFRFKSYNILCRNDQWYKDRVKSLMHLPEFESIWNTIHIDTGIDEIKKAMPIKMPFPEYVTVMFTPDGYELKVRGLQIDFMNKDFPRIISFIPDDDSTRKRFTQLGIPTPDNGWGYLTKDIQSLRR